MNNTQLTNFCYTCINEKACEKRYVYVYSSYHGLKNYNTTWGMNQRSMYKRIFSITIERYV